MSAEAAGGFPSTIEGYGYKFNGKYIAQLVHSSEF